MKKKVELTEAIKNYSVALELMSLLSEEIKEKKYGEYACYFEAFEIASDWLIYLRLKLKRNDDYQTLVDTFCDYQLELKRLFIEEQDEILVQQESMLKFFPEEPNNKVFSRIAEIMQNETNASLKWKDFV